MKALSIRQPWAWLIVNGYKNVENRSWACPRTFHPPERIYVHAGRGLPSVENRWQALHPLRASLGTIESRLVWRDCWRAIWSGDALGAIVGEVTVSAWTDSGATGSPWYEGPYGLILCDPVAYDQPIPYKGRQGLFEVDLP